METWTDISDFISDQVLEVITNASDSKLNEISNYKVYFL